MAKNPLDYDPQKPIKWVTIRSFYFDTQAAFFAARLEDAGIPTFVANNLVGAIIPMGDGGIKLQVPEEAVEDAYEVLQEIKAQDEQRGDRDFRDATLEDIAFQKALHTKSNRPYYLVIAILIIAILGILLRMFMRASGAVPSWMDPF